MIKEESVPLNACPACGAEGGDIVLQLGATPVNSCLLVDTPEQARAIPMGELDVRLCEQCGHISNRTFDDALIQYSQNYEDSQAFSPTFVAYANGLAKRWVEEYQLEGKTVVEIGAGRGDFSRLLIDHGVGRVIAIDPSILPERFGNTRDGRITLRQEWFNDTTTFDRVDAIVFRHVLEHISRPVELLENVRAVLGEHTTVPVLVEIPDMTRILKTGAFWDLFYEHCAYIVPDVARAMFASAGLRIDVMDLLYSDQYLAITAFADECKGPIFPKPQVIDELCNDVNAFRELVQQDVAQWKRLLDESRESGGDVVLWGSGSKPTAFVTLMAQSATAISRIVDINPHKQGWFALGSGIPILAPETLAEDPPTLVIIMNPIYVEEISAQIASLGVRTKVLALR